MGVYKEKQFSLGMAMVIMALVIVVFYAPILLFNPELIRTEGLFAVETANFSFLHPVATAHGMLIDNAPLYPAFVSLLSRCGMPMEYALRVMSLLMLLVCALIVYVASTSRRNGIVAMAFFLFSAITLEHGGEGSPASTVAAALLGTQLLFFRYGVKADWNRAWLVSSIFLILAFLAGGIVPLLFFAFTVIFLRRPMSVKSKFSKPGFVLSILALCLIILSLVLLYALDDRNISLFFLNLRKVSLGYYFHDLWRFLWQFPLRLFPWIIIAWMPFCEALQTHNFDEHPRYCQYLRTVVCSSFALFCVFPQLDVRNLIFLIGPLAILVGEYYEKGMARYGLLLRKLLRWDFIVPIICAASIILLLLLRKCGITWNLNFLKVVFTWLPQSRIWEHVIISGIGILAIAAVALRQGKLLPIWLEILLISIVMAVTYNVVPMPYKIFNVEKYDNNSKRKFGQDIRNAVKNYKCEKIYASGAVDLYGGLFYSGLQVIQIPTMDELPRNENPVFVVTPTFPQDMRRKWERLSPENYKYRKHDIGLWKGELPENANDGK